MNKRFLFLFIIFTFVLSGSLMADNKPIGLAKKKLSNISSNIKKNKGAIRKKQLQKKKAEREFIRLNRELRRTDLQLRQAKQKLSRTKKKIKENQGNIARLEQKYQQKKNLLKKRLVEIYKNKNWSLIDVVFTPDETFAVIDVLYYFERIIKSDIKLIKEIRDEHNNLQKEKANLKKQQENRWALRLEIKKSEQVLQRKKRSKKRYLTKLSSSIKKIKEQNKRLEKSSGEITQLIQKLSKGNNAFFGTGTFIKPVIGWISSKFGYRKHPIFKRYIKHTGVDIAAPRGYKIKASDSGLIIVSGRKKQYKGYGKIIIIDHGRRTTDGKRVSTIYAHMSRIFAKEGQFVKKGDTIGLVGSTGYSTGPHLHFEIRENGIPINPLKYIKR
jgi:murein DD-endopeptidase MepM/ murein hydrolase activator NlpD